MNIHITNLHNIGGTATLAMDGVVQVAKKLDFTEMGVMKRQFYEDYWNTISHHLDGTIASLYHEDIVFFQYPTWNGPDYDKVFVDKIKLYNDVRLVIFVHDLQKLMFDSEQSILDMEISILNKADVLILPSVKMHEYMINNGLRDDIQVLYQKIWEVPGFPCFREHQNLKKMLFTGNWNRFPFLESYHGKTIVEHFDYQKPPRDDDSSFTWRNGFKPIQLMREMSKGGYGLVWCDKEYLERYYSMNQPHKLGFTLASGIPVIVRNGCVHSDFVREKGLGYVVDSLEEADNLVQNTSDEGYAKMISNIAPYQYMLLNGVYTKKLLMDTLICVLEK